MFETLFYGVFVPLFAFFMYLQWGKRKESKTAGGVMVLVFSIILFFFISTQWFLLVLGCYEIYMDIPLGYDTEIEFADWSDTGSVVLFALYVIQVWMGDVFLVYRLYYVSQRSIRYIIFPCMVCVATMVSASGLLRSIATEDVYDPASLAKIRRWGIATFSMTLTENTFCATMISFHIWRMNHDIRFTAQSKTGRVLRIFIESAGMWIVLMFITFFLFLANTPTWLTMLHLTNPILGISFCFMMARLFLLSREELNLTVKTGGRYVYA
jgi:hypothetical protein